MKKNSYGVLQECRKCHQIFLNILTGIGGKRVSILGSSFSGEVFYVKSKHILHDEKCIPQKNGK